MGGCRCSYKNCERATNNSDKNFHFFHYPSKDYERSLKWITNARKPTFLDLPKDQLRNKVVCQNHFETHCFTNANKQRLVHNAIPTLDTGCTVPPDTVNVKVLQANADGTVFTVNTDSMNIQEINKVKSYLITNGDVVLANPLQEEESDIDEADTSKHQLYSGPYNDYKLENTTESIPENTNSIKNEPNQENDTKVTESDEITFVSCGHSYSVPTEATPRPEESNITIKTNTTPDMLYISKTVEKHTEEITKLKKLLHTRIRKKKYRKMAILSKLRALIPSTLYAAVSLHIFRKEENFTPAEKQFLTMLYQSPPAVVNVLNNKFKWKLPRSDVVKNMLLTKNKLK